MYIPINAINPSFWIKDLCGLKIFNALMKNCGIPVHFSISKAIAPSIEQVQQERNETDEYCYTNGHIQERNMLNNLELRPDNIAEWAFATTHGYHHVIDIGVANGQNSNKKDCGEDEVVICGHESDN